MPMSRNNSFSSLAWMGEQGPTTVVDQCLTRHLENEKRGEQHSNPNTDDAATTADNTIFYDTTAPLLSSDQPGKQPQLYYQATTTTTTKAVEKTIRFQVVIWSVGQPDVRTGRVPMKFRVTMFWNHEDGDDDEQQQQHRYDQRNGSAIHNTTTIKRPSMWVMQGRQRAYERVLDTDEARKTVEVPALAILNADSFEVIGTPEVAVLRERTASRLMRWTCMYRATLMQEELNVENFPHDEHDLCLKLGILSQRQRGGRWDRARWRLAMATEDDTQGSTRHPEGLIVDHVRVPEFDYNVDRGLRFNIAPLSVGRQMSSSDTQDERSLVVRLTVVRDSGYYDRNIVPLLCTLNVVAVSLLTFDATNFFQRALLLNNICFLEIGLRMTMDSHLPSVGTQIKMQVVMNRFFYAILYLVLESCAVFMLHKLVGVTINTTTKIDLLAAALALLNMLAIASSYYRDNIRRAASLSKRLL